VLVLTNWVADTIFSFRVMWTLLLWNFRMNWVQSLCRWRQHDPPQCRNKPSVPHLAITYKLVIQVRVATEAYECMYLGHISLLFLRYCWKGRKACSREKTLSVVENTGKSKIRLEEGVGDECGGEETGFGRKVELWL